MVASFSAIAIPVVLCVKVKQYYLVMGGIDWCLGHVWYQWDQHPYGWIAFDGEQELWHRTRREAVAWLVARQREE